MTREDQSLSFWSLRVRAKRVVTIAIAGMMLLGLFNIFRPCQIEGTSMFPWFQTGDVVIINSLDTTPDRYDIVVFEKFHRGEEMLFVKRTIGLPGDIIRIVEGTIYINGEFCEEANKDILFNTHSLDGLFIVPEGHIFVIGDNRRDSYDSRRFGPVPQEDVVGVVQFRLWR